MHAHISYCLLPKSVLTPPSPPPPPYMHAQVSYRLLPEIVLLREYTGEQAHQLQRCFGPGVIEVEVGKGGVEKAVVVNERAYNMSREVRPLALPFIKFFKSTFCRQPNECDET